MIKGPDIAPVVNQPGHYTSKSTITITVDGHQVIIRPTDTLDLSNPEYLIVRKDGNHCRVPWGHISCLDFEEHEIPPTAALRRTPAGPDRRPRSFSLGKRVVKANRQIAQCLHRLATNIHRSSCDFIQSVNKNPHSEALDSDR